MYLRSLLLHNFRCYERAQFFFSPGINAIIGSNAKGKTTILEAIHLLIAGNSFRAQKTKELIRYETASFYVEAVFVKNEIEQTLSFGYDGSNRKIIYNSTASGQTSSLFGILHGVTLTPDDINLIKGSPLERRHFLDLQIAQVNPLYIHYLTRYKRAVKQRNALLKAKSEQSITEWEQELANAGSYLIQQRAQTIANLLRHLNDIALEANVEEIVLNYKTNVSAEKELEGIKRQLIELLQKMRRREMMVGSTLIGPHKDDIVITIAKKEARLYSSEGQQRSCVTLMRLAEWNLLKLISNEKPLTLLDDVGVSLDTTRRDRLLKHLPSLGQVFLTSTHSLDQNLEAHLQMV